jgi:phage terminase small subunit
MPVLAHPKHEQFAQSVAKGITATGAYISAGYSKAGAAASASRLMTNANVSARIRELKTATAASVVKVEIRKRSARVQVGQNIVDRLCRLREARALQYADHPGGATGMLVKEYRGKNGQQEIWKFDAALVSQINATLKQAAIEEGQWSEKREMSGSLTPISVFRARLAAGRQRVAEYAKRGEATKASATVLDNTKHEQFAQSVATGISGTEAYTSVGYSEAGAAASASRLLTNARVSARVEELKTSIAEGVVAVEIRKRSARVEVLQDNLNRMCGLMEARAWEYADHPGGATGMLVKDYRGKNAEQEIWRLDAALVSQINATMKHGAARSPRSSRGGEKVAEVAHCLMTTKPCSDDRTLWAAATSALRRWLRTCGWRRCRTALRLEEVHVVRLRIQFP